MTGAEATDVLSMHWERDWPDAQPRGHELRQTHPDRWVRFHTLPEGKRYAETPPERAIAAARQLTVLAALSTDPGGWIVVAEEWEPPERLSGWSRHLLPTAQPWGPYLVQRGLSDDALRKLLAEAAEDRATFVLTAPDLGWVYAPYDGGIDVFLPTAAARDELRAAHAAWLSPRADGL